MHGLMREGWPLRLWAGYLGTAKRKGRKVISRAYGRQGLPSTLPIFSAPAKRVCGGFSDPTQSEHQPFVARSVRSDHVVSGEEPSGTAGSDPLPSLTFRA
jgi:hypothetical protein